ncbi:MAG TPA: dihydrofolate reductase family protein [Blastocatellia bacterium]|nr:dihydrofolate reductase family protein [Blastocatellia bacterium]
MGRIIVFTNLTLDAVMQSPGRPDEDTRDSFTHGGWATPFAAMQQSGDSLANMGALLLGRWTYESFYSFFPNQKENQFTEFLTNIPKYVASTTLAEPLPWANSTLLKGDAMQAVSRLKEENERDLVVFGSGVLVQSLMRRNLVDEYVLLIHPLILGSGRRLFPDGGAFAALKLRDTRTTNNGVVIVSYNPANDNNAA